VAKGQSQTVSLITLKTLNQLSLGMAVRGLNEAFVECDDRRQGDLLPEFLDDYVAEDKR